MSVGTPCARLAAINRARIAVRTRNARRKSAAIRIARELVHSVTNLSRTRDRDARLPLGTVLARRAIQAGLAVNAIPLGFVAHYRTILVRLAGRCGDTPILRAHLVGPTIVVAVAVDTHSSARIADLIAGFAVCPRLTGRRRLAGVLAANKTGWATVARL